MKVTVHWSSSRKHRISRCAQNTFVILGCVALGVCAFAYFNAGAFQAFERWHFEKALLAGPRGLAGPSPSPSVQSLRLAAKEGVPLGRIEVPRLAISVIVAEGTKQRTLRLAAGHIPGTAFPDEPGNVGIAGHRDMFFRKLQEIRQGDIITFTTLAGSPEYSVEWTRVVKPKDIDVLDVSSQPVLTLITCYPFYYVGPAPERFIVRARRIGQAVSH
jgi:sortase A